LLKTCLLGSFFNIFTLVQSNKIFYEDKINNICSSFIIIIEENLCKMDDFNEKILQINVVSPFETV